MRAGGGPGGGNICRLPGSTTRKVTGPALHRDPFVPIAMGIVTRLMRECDFEFIRTLVYKRSRIHLDNRKRELVAARLAKRLRETQTASVGDYCDLLRSPGQEEECVRLIDAISTNHTFFFREGSHFEFVRSRIVPEMSERSKRERWPRLYAWSAACSSGEEPYSLAMALDDAVNPASWSWHVEATDISMRMLDAAQKAVYKGESVIEKTPPWAMHYFQRGIGPQEGNFRIKPSLHTRVTFRHLNLLEGPPPFSEPMHVIFCRNVMIYFDRDTQAELIAKLARQLVPGGYLIVGHSESLANIAHGLQLVESAIYRRPIAA
jgi:chemotaxis protein methyltransferase CheR